MTTQAPIRLIIIDDHFIVRKGLRSLLSTYSEFEIVAEEESGAAGIAAIQDHAPDVILLDINLPDMTGLDVLRHLQAMETKIPVLMLTSYDDPEYIQAAVELGASGYVLKNISDERLVSAIHAVHSQNQVFGPAITAKLTAAKQSSHPNINAEDIQLLQLLVDGASNDQLAQQLFMSKATVKRRLRTVFDKLGVQTRAQAAATAVRLGLV